MKLLQNIKDALRCFVGKHFITEKSVVEDMGAVFHGGMCSRCFKVKIGKFICNSWDDSLTLKSSRWNLYQGENPKIKEEGYIVYDLDVLEYFAARKIN